MNKNIFKWISIYLFSTMVVCLNLYAAPGIAKNIYAGKLISAAQTDTSMDKSGTHRKSSSHMRNQKKRSDSTSMMHKRSSMSDTSSTHKKKKMSNHTGMLRAPKSESEFVSSMTRYLNRRVKLNSDQVEKVHQVLTDYFSVAHSVAGNLQTDKNGIFAGTHNPVDTTSYISPYLSLNHSTGTTNMYGSRSGSESDSNVSQRAGAKSFSGNDSTNKNNTAGTMGNNTTRQDVTSNESGMRSGSATLEERSVELDQSGLKVEKQIESILTDRQRTRFASIKDNFIDLVRQQALAVKSE